MPGPLPLGPGICFLGGLARTNNTDFPDVIRDLPKRALLYEKQVPDHVRERNQASSSAVSQRVIQVVRFGRLDKSKPPSAASRV